MQMKENIMKRFIQYLFIVTTLFSSGSALAVCNGGTFDFYFDFGNVTVERDAPVGTVIATAVALNSTTSYATCTTITNTWAYAGSIFTTHSSVPYLYNTNIPGVGIQLYSTTQWLPWQGYTLGANTKTAQYYADATKYKLIKTGPIPSGTYSLTQGIVFRHAVDTLGDVFRINIGSGNVTAVACTLNKNSINVPMEGVLGASLTAIGTVAKPTPFDVGLTCDAGAKVNVQMSGIKNTDTSAAGVLQLTNAGAAGVAKGVGIQILYNGTPLALNNRLLLRTSAGGQETFTFTAQYYQTKSAASVTTGSANATMTLDITYQ
jgi:type 1 fimbria pilin